MIPEGGDMNNAPTPIETLTYPYLPKRGGNEMSAVIFFVRGVRKEASKTLKKYVEIAPGSETWALVTDELLARHLK